MKNFTIIMPPPNVTGSLHMGHALTYTIQDVLIRYNKLNGKNTHWQSGYDHAGIAMQMLCKKKLDSKGISNINRNDFIKFMLQEKDISIKNITGQINKMNMSVDWSNALFTLDEGPAKAVKKAFIDLYNSGLIYKDKKLINWDPVLQTTVSNLEVVNKNIQGKMYYIKYYFVKSSVEINRMCVDKGNDFCGMSENGAYIVVATTRPETIFADSAVAISFEFDEKYPFLKKSEIYVPMIKKKIRIIVDEYVNPSKGTGVVKITPAHDFNDFEVGRRHNLECINIVNKDGTFNISFIEGLGVKDARKEVENKLKKADLLVKVESVAQQIPVGDRSGALIEPMLSDQWFLDVKKLTDDAIRVVENDEIIFEPYHWKSTYLNWMKNIEPWCISRQLIWGHRIPVWYDQFGNKYVAESQDDAFKMALDKLICKKNRVVLNENGGHGSICKKHADFHCESNVRCREIKRGDFNEKNDMFESSYIKGIDLLAAEDIKLTQDADVLDTWFSSALWAFSSLGWPDKKFDEHSYPSDVLVTGFDIIFFWVARMIMMSLFFIKKIPFKKIYISQIVLDEKGEKMSKTKGNVVNPLDIIDKYGSDELRLALMLNISNKRHMNFSEKSIIDARNFITKVRNAFKFCDVFLGDVSNNISFGDLNVNKMKSSFNRWFLNKLNDFLTDFYSSFDIQHFQEALLSLNRFIWDDFCGWYIEYTKLTKHKDESARVLVFVKDIILSVLDILVPKFTSKYKFKKTGIEEFKRKFKLLDDSKASDIIKIVSKVRSVKSLLGFDQNEFCIVDYNFDDDDNLVNKFAKVKGHEHEGDLIKTAEVNISSGVVELFFESPKNINIDKKIEKIQKDVNALSAKLQNNHYIEKTNLEKINFEKQKLNISRNNISILSRFLNLK